MIVRPGARMSSFGFTYDNWGVNPSATPGTSVIPGASNVEGAWTQIASGANIAQDCYWVYFQVFAGSSTGAIKNHLLDIGIDPAGGTSYTAFLSNLDVGETPSLAQAGNREYLFPIYIKSGSSVAVRVQGSNATAGTVRIAARFYGHPLYPNTVPVGTFAQTLGTITNSQGPTVTPGNAADGTWLDLGALTRDMFWFQLGYGIDSITITAEYTYFEVAYGDATNKITIMKVMHGGTTAETCGMAMQTSMLACAAYQPAPAGANIYVRARCQNAPDTGYHVNVVAIGGIA